MKNKILIDNNTVDFILSNEELFVNAAEKYSFFVCTSVVEELAKIPDSKQNKRIRLFIALSKFGVTFINDSCFILGYARFGVSNLGEGKVYKEILNDSKNNIRDAIIADTAVANDCILLTSDISLYKKMKKLNYSVMNFEEFKEKTNG